MTQKDATDLTYQLIKDSPMGEESKDLALCYVPYIVKRIYDAGYEVRPKNFPTLTKGEIAQMKTDGVIY